MPRRQSTSDISSSSRRSSSSSARTDQQGTPRQRSSSKQQPFSSSNRRSSRGGGTTRRRRLSSAILPRSQFAQLDDDVTASETTEADATNTVEEEALMIVLESMQKCPKDASVQRFGCGSLQRFCKRGMGSVIMRQEQVVALLAGALLTFPHEDRIQLHAVNTLDNLSSIDGDYVCQQLVECGGAGVLFATRKHYHQSDATIARLASNVLQRIEAYSERLYGEEEDEEAVATRPVVSNIERRERPSISKVSENGTLPLFQVFQLQEATVDMLLGMKLSRTVNASQRQGVSNPALCHSLVHDVMQQHVTNVEVQIKCCQLLVDLSFGHDANKQAFVAAGAIEEICAAMKGFPNHEVLQSVGLAALRNLSTLDDLQLNDRVVGVVVEALRNFPENMYCQETACAILYNFTHSSSRGGFLQPLAESKSLLHKVLLRNHDNAKIVKYASKVLERLERTGSRVRRSSC